MLDLVLDFESPSPLRVLCVGAHCDDIEIGCGATLSTLQTESPAVTIDWVVLSGTELRRMETARSMELFVSPGNCGRLEMADFPDGRFPARYGDIKDFFESLKDWTRPDLILCHEREDRHQDHRLANEMIWSTFRDALILEYEIPKWDGGLGQPNFYVPVSEQAANSKAATLLEAYSSQAGRDWFKRDTFLSMLRLRGVECRSTSGYAEAFHARKVRFNAVRKLQLGFGAMGVR